MAILTNNAPSVGNCISHYKILNLLGEGGMGAVYEAEDQVLGRHIALKLLPRDLCLDHLAVERFQREARAASALNHPNICTVYEIGEWQGENFIALELLEGERLKDRISNRPLPLSCMLDLGIQIADALDAAHRRGVIHRDITPTNIFLTRNGQAKLLDFGLAKLVADERNTLDSSCPTSPSDDGLTSPGTTMGTIGYMSPEQARGQKLDARSDVFSFGAVLYEMVTGKAAFFGNTSAVIFDSILNRQPLPISNWNPDLPTALNTIVFRALEKDRELRYQSAAELRADLRRLKRDVESQVPDSTLSPVELAARPTGSSRRLSAQGLPIVQRQPLRLLMSALQLMYLAFYLIALGRLEEIYSLAQILIPGSGWVLPATVLVSAAVGISVRLYLLSSVVFDHPALGSKFRQLFPVLLLLDQLWALSPLLLVTHIGLGLAFGAMAALLYCPFSQRALIRMAYPASSPLR